MIIYKRIFNKISTSLIINIVELRLCAKTHDVFCLNLLET